MATMTNSERLLSYIESAKAAIKDVTNDAIGHGDDPLTFVIACFVSQAAKIKELLETIENEACRFNCRTQKETWIAAVEWSDENEWAAQKHTVEEAFKEWKKTA